MAKKDTANALRRKGISDPAIEKLIQVFNNQDEVKAATKEQLQNAGLDEAQMEEVSSAFAPKRATKKPTATKKVGGKKVEVEERPKLTFKMPEDKLKSAGGEGRASGDRLSSDRGSTGDKGGSGPGSAPPPGTLSK